jgi:hypothetical protein
MRKYLDGFRRAANWRTLMKNVQCLTAGAAVSLCLSAIAMADDDHISDLRTEVKPAATKRVVVLTGYRNRVIYIHPAYRTQSVVLPDRTSNSVATRQTYGRDFESSRGANRESYHNATKMAKGSNRNDANRTEQKINNNPDQASGNVTPAENTAALDRLTDQAQKEETMHLAEPDGVGAR